MATYGGGASIKESGSLKRTTAGTSSKTLGANEYAWVSIYHKKDDDSAVAPTTYGGLSKGSTSIGATNTTSSFAFTAMAAGQYLVGGGITFSIITTAMGVSFEIDGIEVYSATNFNNLPPDATAQYVIFE